MKRVLLEDLNDETVETEWVSTLSDANISTARANYIFWEP